MSESQQWDVAILKDMEGPAYIAKVDVREFRWQGKKIGLCLAARGTLQTEGRLMYHCLCINIIPAEMELIEEMNRLIHRGLCQVPTEQGVKFHDCVTQCHFGIATGQPGGPIPIGSIVVLSNLAERMVDTMMNDLIKKLKLEAVPRRQPG